MEPALSPEGLLQATVQLVEVKLRLGAQVQHLPIEVLQLHGEGHGYRWVAVQMGELTEDLGSGGHLGGTVQHQEAQGDVKLGGGQPVGGRGGEQGGELLLQLLETGQDGGSIGPEGDEVCGLFLRGTSASLLLCLLWRSERVLRRRTIKNRLKISCTIKDGRRRSAPHTPLHWLASFLPILQTTPHRLLLQMSLLEMMKFPLTKAEV